jgi:glycosyltransferase involved in cell wall biosynthesis
MDSKPLVTVITVSYNAELYIADAIETVLAQSYQHLQYIIGDDCSSDLTWEKINTFNDSRIEAYRNPKNIGEYPNRNKAIDLARGKYLIFIDGDDMIYPHAIEFMVRMMENFPECGYAISYRYKNIFFYPVKLTPAQFHRANFLDQGFNDTAFTNTFFKTDILKQENKLPTEYMAGDMYVRLKIALKHHVLLLNEGLTWWRQTPGQASERLRKNQRKNLDEHFHINAAFINSPHSHLSEQEKVIAFDNLVYSLRYAFINTVKRLRFSDIGDLFFIMRKYQIKTRQLLFSKRKLVNVFPAYSTIKVMREPLEKNPYAVPQKDLENQ